jgi:hypothetical protein
MFTLGKEEKKEEGKKEGLFDIFIITVNVYDSSAREVSPVLIKEGREIHKDLLKCQLFPFFHRYQCLVSHSLLISPWPGIAS